LVFVLLLAAWTFLKAAETGKTRHLLLGAFLVGLGFNIKMLQAIMPLPAFYAVYLIASHHPWWKRLLQLGAATVVLIVVSLAWVVAVDLTPTDQRPYVGSSENNTVLELIIGHNGLSRLGLNQRTPGGSDGPRTVDGGPQFSPSPGVNAGNQPPGGFVPTGNNNSSGTNPLNGGRPPQAALDACAELAESDVCAVNLPNRDIFGTCLTIPDGELLCVPEDRTQPPADANAAVQRVDGPDAPAPDRSDGPGPGSRNASETGTAGVLRLFEEPLVTEASWLLPLILLGIPLLLPDHVGSAFSRLGRDHLLGHCGALEN
jgi:hypothetical protein